jgi:gluconate 2-dehydrogenase gamma chain
MDLRRRVFVKSVLALPAMGAGGAALAEASGPAGAVPDGRATFDGGQWRTLAAVLDHLLPSEPDNPGAPGARELGATRYLDLALAAPGFDAGTRDFVLKGIGWLDDLAERTSHAPFPELDPGTREELLRRVAGTEAGERWLSTLIAFALEALLADPLYGGNPGGVGWAWLGHVPGLPRPTESNRFGVLGWSRPA